MSIQPINIGNAANDGQGDTLRQVGIKINENFNFLNQLISAGGSGGNIDLNVLEDLISQSVSLELTNVLDSDYDNRISQTEAKIGNHDNILIDLQSKVESTVDNVNSINIMLYKSSNEKTLPISEDIDVDLIYSFETNSLEPIQNGETLGQWQFLIPESGRYVHAIQVSVFTTESSKTILSSNWSDPILIFDRGVENLQVDIITSNGNIFRNDQGETDLSAFITNNDIQISDSDYSNYHYEWLKGGNELVCINPTTKRVSHINGNIVTVDTNGLCPLGYGVPATTQSELNTFNGSDLKTISIEAQAVPNNGTLPIQLIITEKGN
jgi:hypothetical protein